MQELNNEIRKVHFIGIGGIGISAIARFLHEKGHKISGSDIKESKTTLELQNEGIEVITPHCKEAIKDQDFVGYSAAIKEEHRASGGQKQGHKVLFKKRNFALRA